MVVKGPPSRPARVLLSHAHNEGPFDGHERAPRIPARADPAA